jgi:hypothetical protein
MFSDSEIGYYSTINSVIDKISDIIHPIISTITPSNSGIFISSLFDEDDNIENQIRIPITNPLMKNSVPRPNLKRPRSLTLIHPDECPITIQPESLHTDNIKISRFKYTLFDDLDDKYSNNDIESSRSSLIQENKKTI